MNFIQRIVSNNTDISRIIIHVSQTNRLLKKMQLYATFEEEETSYEYFLKIYSVLQSCKTLAMQFVGGNRFNIGLNFTTRVHCYRHS